MSPWPPNLPEKPCCFVTPPPTRAPTPASCSLGLVVVSVLVELCDVGGKRDGGGGRRVECCSSSGGGGVEGYPRQVYHSQHNEETIWRVLVVHTHNLGRPERIVGIVYFLGEDRL